MSRSAVLDRTTEAEHTSMADKNVSARNAELTHGARTVQAEKEAPRQRPNEEEVAILAYAIWEEGGRRDGTADEDWFRAEEILLSDRSAAAQA